MAYINKPNNNNLIILFLFNLNDLAKILILSILKHIRGNNKNTIILIKLQLKYAFLLLI